MNRGKQVTQYYKDDRRNYDDRQNEEDLIRNRMEERLHELEFPNLANVENDCVLTKNVLDLGKKTGLTECEMSLLIFFIMVSNEELISDTLDYLGNINSNTMFRLISLITELDSNEIQKSLGRKSNLHSAGFIKIEKSLQYFNHKFELLDGLDDVTLCENINTEELLSSYFKELPSTGLRLSDFPQFKKEIKLMSALLAEVLSKSEPGINIMFYGPPGTGKTELAKAISKNVSDTMYAINTEDLDGDSISAHSRLRSYQLCQRLLKSNPCCVIFDEVEDVFDDYSSNPFFRDNSKKDKGWINSILDENPVPTIWICNSVGDIDPAFLRRYTYSLEFETPPRVVRERLLKKSFKKLSVKKELITNLAKNEHLVPSQIDIASRAAKLVKNKTSLKTEEVIEMIIDHSLKLRRIPQKALEKSRDSMAYSLEYLNTDYELGSLNKGLKSNPIGRFLLYGPPGSGKTQFVRYLSEVMDKPLFEKGCSDLLGSFVGQTE